MLKVNFYDKVNDYSLKFAVIITKMEGKWIFCKHKDRDTYEIPGGHRESGESILDTAKRELYEETGAVEFEITPICVYSVVTNKSSHDEETFGMLYYADVQVLENELHSEIEKLAVQEYLVENWTYPLIQPLLLDEAKRRGYVSF